VATIQSESDKKKFNQMQFFNKIQSDLATKNKKHSRSLDSLGVFGLFGTVAMMQFTISQYAPFLLYPPWQNKNFAVL
jgi:hypothetical protein